MFKIFYRHVNSSFRNCFHKSVKRYFLSNAYQCTEAWEKRLQNQVFQNVDPGSFYFHLVQDFKANRRIKLTDVDIFINCLTDNKYILELEDILMKLRCYPETVLFPERTSYATGRWLLEHAPTEKILEILGDRLTYGIFPDYVLMNMFMDKFLKAKDSVAAVKIAVLQMQQEDIEHPITKAMGLYSCYNYLASSDVWKVIHAPKEDSDDEEIVKIKLLYIRNPYFDDHFDIKIPNHLVGKTLWLFGINLEDPLGLSSQLVGLVLYEKYDQCASLLKKCIENKSKIYSGAIAMARDFIENTPKKVLEENEENNENTNEKKESTENDNSATDSNRSLKIEISNLLDKINKSNIIEGNLLAISENLVKESVLSQEEIDIKNQCEAFKKWEIERENSIKEENDRQKLEHAQSEIETIKKELELEERKLFFFDNEELIKIEVEKQEERMKNVRHFKIKKKQDMKPEIKTYF